uniref:Uncharacterized protein n=1 Tax=Mustela putorius furo TaxID=9669 RepID=M3XLT1_MUSPF
MGSVGRTAQGRAIVGTSFWLRLSSYLHASGPGSFVVVPPPPPLRGALPREDRVPGQVAPGPALQQDDLAPQRAEAPADEEAAEAALQGEGRQVQDALPHALQQLVQGP